LIPSKETTHISPASFDAKRIETLSDNTSIKDEVPEKTEVCPYCGCEKNPNSVKCIECGQYFAKKPPVKTSDPASIEVQEPRSQGIIRGIVYMVIGVILFYFGLTVLRGGLINWISDIASIMIFLSGLESIYHSITKPSSG